MRFRIQEDTEEESHGIDLAPMLDFFMNLLIFFIITAAFVAETGINVDRPSASTAERQDKTNILVGISASGEIWVDRQRVDIRLLRSTIQKLKLENPNAAVVMQADRNSRTGVMVEAMDQIRLGGIRNIAVAATLK